MRHPGPWIALCLSLVSWGAQAAKTNFLDAHLGLTLGGGRYAYWLPHDNIWDPITPLAPAGTEVSGTRDLHLLPLKLGFFVDRGPVQIEPYLRYVWAFDTPWKASGSLAGTGHTRFKSLGGGANLSVAVFRRARFRLLLQLQGEMVFQKVDLTLRQSGEDEILPLSTRALNAGVGVQPEVWLGDLWSLGVFAGYIYGFQSTWQVRESGELFGVAHGTGALKSAGGTAVPAQFGGFYAELGLRLHFYK